MVKQGMVLDATFITADPGHANADKPRGDKTKTRRSRDGTWINKKQYISKLDKDHGLIQEIAREGEVVYRDKGYRCTGKCHYETGNEILST